MNHYEVERPEWWEVEVGNLLADPDALRDLLDDQVNAIRYWQEQTQRARDLAVRLECELAKVEETP